MRIPRERAQTGSRCVRVKFLLPGLRCHSDDLRPPKCSKARNITVAESDNMASLPPIQPPKCASLFGDAALRGHSNHGEHPERLPSRRVLKAAGKKRETRGKVMGAACVRCRACPGLFAERGADDRRAQTDGENVHVGVLFDSPTTDRTQTDSGWGSLRKQINHPFLHKHGGLRVFQQRQTRRKVTGAG